MKSTLLSNAVLIHNIRASVLSTNYNALKKREKEKMLKLETFNKNGKLIIYSFVKNV